MVVVIVGQENREMGRREREREIDRLYYFVVRVYYFNKLYGKTEIEI